MRILQLHSDFIVFKPIEKEINTAEEATKEEVRVEEVVVLFIAVEAGDNTALAQRAIDDARAFLGKLKANRLLIYPFAHLSSNLSEPSTAFAVIKDMEAYAKQKGIETFRAPFGWNKQFTISIKGHPLAEMARSYTPTPVTAPDVQVGGEGKKDEEPVSAALKAEDTMKSYWHILQTDGSLVPIEEFKFKGQSNLQKFANYEIKKTRAVTQMPPHVPLMKRLEIADYESGSDPGNIRWYPKGRMIKSLLEQYVSLRVAQYGGMEVETPLMYDFNHPSLASYLHRFPARQYVLKSEDKELFLRFAACFGQFLMAHDAQISYKQLPLKLFELTRYSFRREKSGEVVGLKRLRAFTMPDCHAFCADYKQAKAEFMERFDLSLDVLSNIGLVKDDYEIAIRFTKDFYTEHKEFIAALAQKFGKPMLAEVWNERFFYFALKWDLNFVDNQDKAAALSTDQIDVENAKRYEITYVDEKGEKQYPLILHCSPSGALERDIYALLEKAYREQITGKAPMLPLWLSPTQVRLIPLSDKFLDKVTELAQQITAKDIRVDIDDSSSTLQKKIREAEQEWIPYIIVVGEKELESGTLSVRIRETKGKQENLTTEELIDKVSKQITGKPFKPLPLPLYLSKRPAFHG
ncbi:threonine--tRNA ligase [Candidatus Bathycorpusculum sp.]|uniref:threonine--tRNA ligase n=1 Tax=Candidatus Bathycorpusculum sp. TaxID=2994959 RepID=UPI0028337E55|nr:threonine--tRNA ligase [Candidatus Termitimicrobium sp.]MCL2432042.1 threonine--tRNA ligase [Candidatus Termitimicrobium sp.]